MATTKITLVDEKINELKSAIEVMKRRNVEDPTDPTYISKNTRSTQLYHMGREKRVLGLIKALIAANPDIKLSSEDQETFVLITTLASERVLTKYQFAVGDSLLDIMTKYENLSRKDLDAKLEKLGLKMDYAGTKKVVKA
ncbi:MAG: hypothetical protein J6Q48_09700 [Bacteroidaceae bacterium]|nr:hypothetical protein [Bacteroidaceae bacterium]